MYWCFVFPLVSFAAVLCVVDGEAFTVALRQSLPRFVSFITIDEVHIVCLPLAVLDAYRVAMCHSAAIATLGNDKKARELLFVHAQKGGPLCLTLVRLCSSVAFVFISWVCVCV
jgi:hypothetical protein